MISFSKANCNLKRKKLENKNTSRENIFIKIRDPNESLNTKVSKIVKEETKISFQNL